MVKCIFCQWLNRVYKSDGVVFYCGQGHKTKRIESPHEEINCKVYRNKPEVF